MGLFDRFKTSQPGPVEISPPEAVARNEPAQMRIVPDLDDDSDIASLSHDQFDAALTSRLVGAERIQSTGLGFSYASPFADHIHEVLTLDLPVSVVTLPDSRIAETGRRVPGLRNRGRTNLLELLETTEVD